MFEVIVGAMLMPQTSWRNVERAIANLKRKGLLEPARLAGSRLKEIRELVRPAGLHGTKPGRLRSFSRYVMRKSNGDVEAFLRGDPDQVREEMLSLPGIGPETADSILLYAANAPVFVVDAYTVRVANRVGLVDSEDYYVIQTRFQEKTPRDVGVYQEYHALIVELAKRYCRPKPMCEGCPLAGICDYSLARARAGFGRREAHRKLRP